MALPHHGTSYLMPRKLVSDLDLTFFFVLFFNNSGFHKIVLEDRCATLIEVSQKSEVGKIVVLSIIL